jgi:hypothetical protein
MCIGRHKDSASPFARRQRMSLRLPPDANTQFEAAAEKRGLTREAMIKLLLLEVASEPYLIDNILDDGV